MYRGLTTFTCTRCGRVFKSHDIEYHMTAFSVPQRCPECGSVRTVPFGGGEEFYKHIWEEIEQAEKAREEKQLRIEAKMKANEEEQRKKQAKKRKHQSRKQKEKMDRKREKKAAKRNKQLKAVESKKESIIILWPTFFPLGTPLRIDDE
ncbi:MAG: hypothetical protein IJ622_05710 [Bacteroidales bacterium]|nr:hypothetical protein [Bacteroidales bacterium]